MSSQPERAWPTFPSIVERDYESWYFLHQSKDPFYAQRHINGLYIIGFAPHHPLRLNPDDEVVEVDFSAGDQDLSGNAAVATGKRKRDARGVKSDSILCVVKCASGAEYPVPACVPDTVVITINKALLKHPQLLHQDGDNKGWIAIVMMKKSKPNNPQSIKCLMSHKNYLSQFVNKQMDVSSD